MINKRSFYSAIIFSFTCLYLIFAGCIDAGKRNASETKKYSKLMNDRQGNSDTISTGNRISKYIPEMLVSSGGNQSWKDALAVLREDEKRNLDFLKQSIGSAKKHTSILAGNKLLNAGEQGLVTLIKNSKDANSEAEKRAILVTLRRFIKKIKFTEEIRIEITALLQKWASDEIKSIQNLAVNLWTQIANEVDFPQLAVFLDTDNAITRSLIYSRLSRAKSANVVPVLLKHLNSSRIEVRAYSINLLRFLTGKYFGFNPSGEPIARQFAVCRWVSYVLSSKANLSQNKIKNEEKRK